MNAYESLRDEFTDDQIRDHVRERENVYGVALNEHGISCNLNSNHEDDHGWFALSELAVLNILNELREKDDAI